MPDFERNIIFLHGRAYDITWTMALIAELFDRGDIRRHVMESILSVLSDLRFCPVIDYGLMIDNPDGGHMIIELFFRDWGQEIGSDYAHPLHIADIPIVNLEEAIEQEVIDVDLPPIDYYSGLSDEELLCGMAEF